MPIMSARVSMATGTTATPLTGAQYETLDGPAMIRIGIHSNVNLVLATIFSGPDLLAEEGPVPFSAAEALPLDPDEYQWEDEAMAGDKIKVILRNTNAGTALVNVVCKITPLA